MKKSNIIIFFFLAVIILVILYFTVYKDAQLLGGLKTTYDNNEILHKAGQFVQDLNVKTNNLQPDCNLQANQELIRQVQSLYGYKKGNELLRTSIPGYYWKVTWNKSSKTNISFGFSTGEQKSRSRIG